MAVTAVRQWCMIHYVRRDGLYDRLVSPDFVRVFRYRGTRGETPEQLAEMLKHPKNFLASDNLYKRRYGCDLTSLVDKQFYLFGDTTNTYNLAASLQVVRYGDYFEAWNSYCMVAPMPEEWYDLGTELCVRVKEDQDRDFIARLKADSEKLYRVGKCVYRGCAFFYRYPS